MRENTDQNNSEYGHFFTQRQPSHRKTRLFIADFLQNEIHEGNVMLIKGN